MLALQGLAIESKSSTTISTINASKVASFHDSNIIKESSKIDNVGNLRGIAATNDGIVWVGGTLGKVAKSIDGGRTWKTYSPSSDQVSSALDFRAISVFNSSVACVMSSGHSRVYKTTNGGDSWRLVLLPDTFINAMKFWDEKNGIILGDPKDGKFVIYKTNDGGDSWRESLCSIPIFSGEAAFAASNSCLAVYGDAHVWFCTGSGALGRIFYSTDQGLNWNVSTTTISTRFEAAGLFSLAFKNQNEGIAVGGDYQRPTSISSSNVYITSDGGRIWYPAPQETISIELSARYLPCVGYNSAGKAFVIDGSKGDYNALTFAGNRGYAVGPHRQFATFQT